MYDVFAVLQQLLCGLKQRVQHRLLRGNSKFTPDVPLTVCEQLGGATMS